MYSINVKCKEKEQHISFMGGIKNRSEEQSIYFRRTNRIHMDRRAYSSFTAALFSFLEWNISHIKTTAIYITWFSEISPIVCLLLLSFKSDSPMAFGRPKVDAPQSHPGNHRLLRTNIFVFILMIGTRDINFKSDKFKLRCVLLKPNEMNNFWTEIVLFCKKKWNL